MKQSKSAPRRRPAAGWRVLAGLLALFALSGVAAFEPLAGAHYEFGRGLSLPALNLELRGYTTVHAQDLEGEEAQIQWHDLSLFGIWTPAPGWQAGLNALVHNIRQLPPNAPVHTVNLPSTGWLPPGSGPALMQRQLPPGRQSSHQLVRMPAPGLPGRLLFRVPARPPASTTVPLPSGFPLYPTGCAAGGCCPAGRGLSQVVFHPAAALPHTARIAK